MRFITFYLVHAALYPLVPAGVMLLEERPEVLFGLSPVQVEHLLFLGIYHQFGILVPLSMENSSTTETLGGSGMAHLLLATGASLPFAHISEGYDQCPFIGIALSADAEWVTRKEDYDRLPLELHFMVLLFSFVAYSFTMLYSSFSISFHLYFISFLLLNNRSPEEPIIVVM